MFIKEILDGFKELYPEQYNVREENTWIQVTRTNRPSVIVTVFDSEIGTRCDVLIDTMLDVPTDIQLEVNSYYREYATMVENVSFPWKGYDHSKRHFTVTVNNDHTEPSIGIVLPPGCLDEFEIEEICSIITNFVDLIPSPDNLPVFNTLRTHPDFKSIWIKTNE